MTYTDIKSDGGMDPRNEGLPEPEYFSSAETDQYGDTIYRRAYTADQLLAYGAAKDAEIERLRADTSLQEYKYAIKSVRGLRTALAERDAEIERLRSALNNAEDALLNSQTYITASHPIGFGKVCKDVNELALGIVRTALKETK